MPRPGRSAAMLSMSLMALAADRVDARRLRERLEEQRAARARRAQDHDRPLEHGWLRRLGLRLDNGLGVGDRLRFRLEDNGRDARHLDGWHLHARHLDCRQVAQRRLVSEHYRRARRCRLSRRRIEFGGLLPCAPDPPKIISSTRDCNTLRATRPC